MEIQGNQEVKRGDKISYITPEKEKKTGVFLQLSKGKFAVMDDIGFIDIVEEIQKH